MYTKSMDYIALGGPGSSSGKVLGYGLDDWGLILGVREMGDISSLLSVHSDSFKKMARSKGSWEE